MQRVLVTGGAGFIGSALVRRLLADSSIEVLNYDALTYAGMKESLADLSEDEKRRHQFVHANLNDAEVLDNALREFRPDTAMHLAAESHVDRSIAAPDVFIETNVRGTATLLKAWLTHRDRLPASQADELRFLQVSTDEVYGSIPKGKDSVEGDTYLPSSPYSASKAAADHLVHAFETTYGLQAIICHATNNYGARQFPEKLIPLVIQRILAGEPIPVFGKGTQKRDWLFVDDHCEGLIMVAREGKLGQSYHVGASDLRTNLEVIRLLCDLVDQRTGRCGSQKLIAHVADRPGHDSRYSLNANKLRSELGWSPQVAFEQGLQQTVDWYLANQEWVDAALSRE